MNRFLAYFDLLGYKKFIEKNTPEHIHRRNEHIFARNPEMALADHRRKEGRYPGTLISDISETSINCLGFSDTIVFWSNGESLQDFIDLLKVAYAYNYFNIGFEFPSRGCIVYGDIWFTDFSQVNEKGSVYKLNMIYGNALIEAHGKAENQSWAGCVIDNSAIEYLNQIGDISSLLKEYTIPWEVQYKDRAPVRDYALRLVKGAINETLFSNMVHGIQHSFTGDNKGEIKGRVKEIYDNTITFLIEHKMKFPHYYYLDATNDNGTKIYAKIDNKTITRVIRTEKDGTVYEITSIPFDPDNDREVYSAQEVTLEIFEEHYIQATK
ncbi:MAG: hypothetical protein K9G49_04690 [Taibaiella sp.]|nr:hypothetical protein [Taibaiella sp.]